MDGRSQPLFIDEDLEHERETMGGTDALGPARAARARARPRPGGTEGDHAYGSFLVYRKLEQDVRAFKQQEAQVACALGLTGEDAERAGALLVGRYEDGTPLALAADDGMGDPVPNDFTYDDDPGGARCPLGAHIRRMNPRVAEHGDPHDDRAPRPGLRGADGRSGGRRPREQADWRRRPPLHGRGRPAGAAVRAAAARRERRDGGPFDAVMGQRRTGEPDATISLPDRWGDPGAPRSGSR